MEYYSAIKKDEIMPCVVAWMDLEVVILSDVSQTQKDTYHMTLFICGFWKRVQMNLFIEQKKIHK